MTNAKSPDAESTRHGGSGDCLYEKRPPAGDLFVEIVGFEPATPTLQMLCSTN